MIVIVVLQINEDGCSVIHVSAFGDLEVSWRVGGGLALLIDCADALPVSLVRCSRS